MEIPAEQGLPGKEKQPEERATGRAGRGRTEERNIQAQEEGSREASGKSEIEKQVREGNCLLGFAWWRK